MTIKHYDKFHDERKSLLLSQFYDCFQNTPFSFSINFFGGVNQLEIVMSYFHQVIRDSGISILQVIHLNPDLIATITFVYDYSKPNIYVDRASHNST